MFKIYILHNDFYWFIEVFTSKDDRYYIQYQEKWKNFYETKRWKLEDLVWTYPYWDSFITYRLFEKEVEIIL